MLETVRQYASEKLSRIRGERGRSRPGTRISSSTSPRRPRRVWRARSRRRGWSGWRPSTTTSGLLWGGLRKRRKSERGLRLAAALLRFWWFRGHLIEGRAHLESLLDLSGTPVRDEVRAKALHALAVLIYRQADDAVDDWSVARFRLEESLEIYRRLGNEAARGRRASGSRARLRRTRRVERGARLPGREPEDRAPVGKRTRHRPLAVLPGPDVLASGREFSRHAPTSRKVWASSGSWTTGSGSTPAWFTWGTSTARRAGTMLPVPVSLQTNEVLPLVRFPGAPRTRWMVSHVWPRREGEAERALRLGGATDALRRTYGVTIGPSSASRFSTPPGSRRGGPWPKRRAERPGKRAGR